MGNCCTKSKSPKKKVFTLRKISDTDHNEQEAENPVQLNPNTFNNSSPRRKSSFFQHSNQNNGKVTFHEKQHVNHLIDQLNAMKRNSVQFLNYVHPQQKRIIRETSIVEKRRTSEGHKMINEYEIGQKLGEGSFGKVKLVKKRFLGFEQKYATKIFKKNILQRINEFRKDEDGKMKIDNAFETVKREIAVLKKLNHKNVLKLYEVIDDPNEEKLYLILEYAENGEIISWDEDKACFKLKKPTIDNYFSEDYVRKLFRDCIKGLLYLHENGIIHRDLKPGNILLDKDNNVKICDFGLAFILSNEDLLKSSKGTYHFMAPETFNEQKIEKGISGKLADIWSLGVTLYAFIFLVLPFYEKNLVTLINSIKGKSLKFPAERKISPELKSLLTQILDKNPKKRLTLDQVISHEWVNKDYPTKLESEIFGNENIQITDKDVENALMPIERVVFLKAIAKKLTRSLNSRSSSPVHSKNVSTKDVWADGINKEHKSQSPGLNKAAFSIEQLLIPTQTNEKNGEPDSGLQAETNEKNGEPDSGLQAETNSK